MFSVLKLASDTLTESYSPSLFNFFYESYSSGFIIAEVGHKVIGFVIGVKLNPEIAKILMLSVSDQHRRKSIGSLLLKQLETQAIRDKVKYIELEVRTDNNKAIKFYEKNGFKIIEKLKEFYQNGESAYTMKKKLIS
jgi:ribosomal-protein-alanine N-acetyltransferase